MKARTTVFFKQEIYNALRLKSAATGRSISEIVNGAIRHSLAEDAQDLEAFESRFEERNLDFDAVVKALRRREKM